jgi:hypothetical protein
MIILKRMKPVFLVCSKIFIFRRGHEDGSRNLSISLSERSLVVFSTVQI